MILDTNGLSAVADREAALEPILRQAAEVAVPVIVLGEYRYGIQQSRDRQRFEQWFNRNDLQLPNEPEDAVKVDEYQDHLDANLACRCVLGISGSR
ncbi:MAG TPA: hypothetical protein VN946_05685 [Terriglobales bacterium]|nr:hypothetical protein [Terriglobales bacterium]